MTAGPIGATSDRCATTARDRDCRARFWVCHTMLWYGCVAAWPLAHEAAVVAVYAALVRAGVDPNLARETVDVAPLTYVWPDATCTDDGRRCYAREDVRAGLDYSDEGAVPDALDFMLAMGAQR